MNRKLHACENDGIKCRDICNICLCLTDISEEKRMALERGDDTVHSSCSLGDGQYIISFI